MINKSDIVIHIVGKEIKLNGFNSHYELIIVGNTEEEINGCFICNINEFSGPPLNVTTLSSGQKNIRLK